MNLNDLKPIEISHAQFEIDTQEKMCADCKKERAELIRGKGDYLCVKCFKKWRNLK
jgi:hypothetical protein